MTALPIHKGTCAARWRADFVLAFVALIWGTTFVVVKSALGEISAVYFLACVFGSPASVWPSYLSGRFDGGRRAVFAGLKGGAVAAYFYGWGTSFRHLG